MNPLDTYLTAKEKQAADKKVEDIRLWHEWKADPTPDKMEPLLKRFEPVIMQRVKMLSGAPNIQPSALHANLQAHAIKAFETYNPERAALSTHVTNRLKKGLRFVQKNQNLAKIPEATISLIGPVKSATEELHDQFGRPPTMQEISDYMGVPIKQIRTVQRSQVRDISGSAFETDPTPRSIQREQEVLPLLRMTLKTDEQEMFDYLYGLNGKPRLTSMGDIAKRMGKSPSQISRIRGRIEAQYRRYE